MQYRKDIQILRGIAVILVVLFHLDFSTFKSGFLGVDVFFVISGFLMYWLYNAEKKSAFFIKRVKRLLPAYFTTIALTLVAAAVITVPVDFNQVVNQAIFGTFLSSNIGFWLQNSYFSKAEFNPLLHLWSLGVEAHFYLCIPIIAWFLAKRQYFLPLLILLSLCLCFVALSVSAKTSFFMMPLRLWEFLIGYGIASLLIEGAAYRSKKYSWLGGLGLLSIIFIPLMSVDGLSSNIIIGHPGLFALLVVLASALVLYFGLPVWLEESKISRCLVYFGQYSYAIYLVHFPVIVLYLYEPFSGTVLKPESFMDTILMFSLIALFAIILYHLVENPCRKVDRIQYKILAAPVLIVVLCISGLFLQQYAYTEKEMLIFNAWEDRAAYRCGKIARINPMKTTCRLTRNIDDPEGSIFFVGNSHADSIKNTFVKVAVKNNINLFFTVQNIPLMKGGIQPKKIINEALNKNIDTIVLHYSPSKIGQVDIIRLVELAGEHNIHVSLIMPVPTWSEHVPKALYGNIKHNLALPSQTLSDYYLTNQSLVDTVNSIQSNNFSVYSTAELFCQEDCKMMSKDGEPYYFDKGHLTLTGSEIFAGIFDTIIADMKKNARLSSSKI